jgi:predicted dienelactone hydrolase
MNKTVRYAVRTKTYTFIDRSRTVAASHTGTGKPGPRVLRTFVWYPVETKKAGASNAQTFSKAMPFPLILFAPGFDASPIDYQRLLESWARSGYVVASPAFPLTNPRAIGGLDESDISNQPADLSFILTQLLRSSRSPGPLQSLIDPHRIAVAGQSDGAEVALAAAYGKCCFDPRFDAAIVMAGQILPFQGNLFAGRSAPLLVIQGSADTVNAPAYSRQIYRAASAPKYLLWLRGADHVQPFMTGDHYESVTSVVSLEFLNRYIRQDARAAVGLPRSASRDSTLRSAP